MQNLCKASKYKALSHLLPLPPFKNFRRLGRSDKKGSDSIKKMLTPFNSSVTFDKTVQARLLLAFADYFFYETIKPPCPITGVRRLSAEMSLDYYTHSSRIFQEVVFCEKNNCSEPVVCPLQRSIFLYIHFMFFNSSRLREKYSSSLSAS